MIVITVWLVEISRICAAQNTVYFRPGPFDREYCGGRKENDHISSMSGIFPYYGSVEVPQLKVEKKNYLLRRRYYLLRRT